jgi:ankyrin repeat protein
MEGSGSGAALLATLLLEAVGAGPAPQLAQNCAGWTPLHIAAFMGKTKHDKDSLFLM